jgi:hypothetical protein
VEEKEIKKEKEFNYGKHFSCFFTNISYIFIGSALLFWVFLIVGLLIMPEQTRQVIDNLKTILGG